MQTGPGRLFVGSTQRFVQDGLPVSLRCNHSVHYDAARGPQPLLVQQLLASAVSVAFDPEAEALHFQLTTALRAGEGLITPARPAALLKAGVMAHPGDGPPRRIH